MHWLLPSELGCELLVWIGTAWRAIAVLAPFTSMVDRVGEQAVVPLCSKNSAGSLHVTEYHHAASPDQT
jgi:hypothetical protein